MLLEKMIFESAQKTDCYTVSQDSEKTLEMAADFQSCLNNACEENGNNKESQIRLVELGKKMGDEGLAVECLAFM
jgi:hypothetical protein